MNVKSVLAEDRSNTNEGETEGSASESGWNRMVIKAEQGFNVLLTVRKFSLYLLICMYRYIDTIDTYKCICSDSDSG